MWHHSRIKPLNREIWESTNFKPYLDQTVHFVLFTQIDAQSFIKVMVYVNDSCVSLMFCTSPKRTYKTYAPHRP